MASLEHDPLNIKALNPLGYEEIISRDKAVTEAVEQFSAPDRPSLAYLAGRAGVGEELAIAAGIGRHIAKTLDELPSAGNPSGQLDSATLAAMGAHALLTYARILADDKHNPKTPNSFPAESLVDTWGSVPIRHR